MPATELEIAASETEFLDAVLTLLREWAAPGSASIPGLASSRLEWRGAVLDALCEITGADDSNNRAIAASEAEFWTSVLDHLDAAAGNATATENRAIAASVTERRRKILTCLAEIAGESNPPSGVESSRLEWRATCLGLLALVPGGGGGEDPEVVISGTAFPGEALTSTAAGQWIVDGSPVPGETGDTYVVRLTDIGKSITQDGAENSLTCWHPADIPQVKTCRVATLGPVLNAVGPDEEADDGETVRRWTDIVNGWSLDQATGSAQPVRLVAAVNGNDALQFSSSSHRLFSSSGEELDVFRDVAAGGIIVACNDGNISGGANNHVVSAHTVAESQTVRFGINTKGQAAALLRLTDAQSSAHSATAPLSAGWHVVEAVGDFAGGVLTCYVDGEAGTPATFAGAAIADTPSQSATMGATGNANTYFTGQIAVEIKWSGAAPLSDADLKRLRRFAGLIVGLDIPLT